MDMEMIGKLADKADNLIGASKLPLPLKVHLDQLVLGLEEISKELKKIYAKQTGENPWE